MTAVALIIGCFCKGFMKCERLVHNEGYVCPKREIKQCPESERK